MPSRYLKLVLTPLALVTVAACAGTRPAPISLTREMPAASPTKESAVAGIKPSNLRCESAVNPFGIDIEHPVLSWTLEPARSGLHNLTQTAYQVLAASSEDALRANRADLWDSGKVTSKESLQIPYAGAALRSGARAYWKVRVWDGHDRPSRYSRPASWETGILSPADWTAQWIEPGKSGVNESPDPFAEHPAPLLRKEFSAQKTVRSARAYVTGLGYYELYLNGNKVGDHVLDPGWTDFSKRVYYSAFDVTREIREGRNALGIMLGNGWYNPLPLNMWGHINIRENLPIGAPKAILQLDIEYADGSRDRVVTDTSWRAADGPIRKNNIYLGEVYDARRELPGWARAGFDDSAWRGVTAAAAPGGRLTAQPLPPVRITRTVKPVTRTEPAPGVYIFDLGQNFAGWVTMRCKGAEGAHIQLRYGELLHPDGSLNPMTSVAGQIKNKPVSPDSELPPTAWQSDTYICRGHGIESYTPRFTWHGFRYVEVTGYQGAPPLEAIEGHRLNTDVEPAGAFRCSNRMFNQIQDAVLWTELSNLFSVQSDCPHRERFGYGGDIVATSEMAILNFDMERFYAKAVQDLADAARANGGFTETAPFVGISDQGLGEKSGPVEWGTAHPLLQWQLYQYYGNTRILEQHYEETRRWLSLLESQAKDFILANGIGDHESLVPKNNAVTGTAFFYWNAVLGARIARILGHTADAEHYEKLAESVKAAFNAKFLHADTGLVDAGTQVSQAAALYLDLAPSESRGRVLDRLVEDIQTTHSGHLTTGIFGTKFMLMALSGSVRADVAAGIVKQREFPGWGHMLANGATTLWEHWEFSDNTFSHNHPMFGSVSEWFYKALAGIAPAPDAKGFDRITIKPHVVEGLSWVRASYNSVRGPVRSEWRKSRGVVTIKVTIPPNTIAKVYVRGGNAELVSGSSTPSTLTTNTEPSRDEDGYTVFSVGSGRHEFRAKLCGVSAQ